MSQLQISSYCFIGYESLGYQHLFRHMKHEQILKDLRLLQVSPNHWTWGHVHSKPFTLSTQVPSFTQGFDWHSSTSVSQWVPVIPSGQTQTVPPPTFSLHTPSFWHTLPLQSRTSESWHTILNILSQDRVFASITRMTSTRRKTRYMRDLSLDWCYLPAPLILKCCG